MAVFGTTISFYLFFWQASQEVEEQEAEAGEKPLKHAPGQAPAQLRTMRTGTYLGIRFSNFIAFSIMLDAAAVLHAHGQTDIQTATQRFSRVSSSSIVCGQSLCRVLED